MTQAVEDTHVLLIFKDRKTKSSCPADEKLSDTFFFFLSYHLQGMFFHNQQKTNSGNAEDAHRNLQRLSQVHPRVF